MLLPFQGADARGVGQPRALPWAMRRLGFQPAHCNGWLRCWARQFGASAACVAYRGRAESAKGRGGSAERSLAENGLKAQKLLAQGKRSDTLGTRTPRHVTPRRGKSIAMAGAAWCCGNVVMLCFYAFALSGRRYVGQCQPRALPWAMSRLGFQPVPLHWVAALLGAAILRIGCMRRV